jgi:hypothetical protein
MSHDPIDHRDDGILERDQPARRGEVVRRIVAEFLEMPGLRLTAAQAQRLWDVDAPTCASVLAALTEARFLIRTRDGAYVRPDGAYPPALP